MDIVGTYGRYVDQWSEKTPGRARTLLKLGWEAQGLKYKVMPDRRLTRADQYLADMMMQQMLKPLKSPEESAIVSVFTPCELIQETGFHPYNVEAFSCFISASKAERTFLETAEDAGLSETLCSYHKTFIGAAVTGLLPKPAFIVYTSLACDANLLTFRYLAKHYDVPCFAIDVPSGQTKEDITYVTDQLHEMKHFLEVHTGRAIDDESLKSRMERSARTLKKYDACQKARAEHFVPTDLVSPMYAGMTNNVFLGTEENEHFADMLLEDIQQAPPSEGKKLYWMHTIPFWSQSVKDCLSLNQEVVITGCELAQMNDIYGYEDPYEEMAARLVFHPLNGSITRRIENGIRRTRETGADGAVWFNHWGCKHTLGGSQLARKKFEEAGIPLLVLDGDGCDRSHGGEGQTATRLQAFLEMLGDDAHGQ